MTDAEMRGRLLLHFHALRHNNGGWVPASDTILAPEPVPLRVIGGVCQQLADVNLIQWKPLQSSSGLVDGMAKITGQGVAAVESGRAASIDIRFPSTNETVSGIASSETDIMTDGPEKSAAIRAAEGLSTAETSRHPKPEFFHMARRPTSQSAPPSQPVLIRPRAEIEQRLKDRIRLGIEIQNKPHDNQADMARYIVDTGKWRDYNAELIKRNFSDVAIYHEYDMSTADSYVDSHDTQAFMRIPLIGGSVGQQIATLESILERLELLDDGAAIPADTSATRNLSKVFIVHGHDEAAKLGVARFIERLGFEAIILHERANKGRTIITKFREEAADVGFAVVLMTPDDVGRAKDAAELKSRARQNVVFELAFFIGALGSNCVAALVKGDIEKPSDFDGVVYLSLDAADWKTKLAQELEAAGYAIDWRKAAQG